MEDILIKKIKDAKDLENVMEIEKSAWGMPDYTEATPVHILKALAENGGIILGAFYNGNMIGFNMGWAVGCNENRYFYSHMTGVLNEYKYKNVGYKLKIKQREEVLKLGIDLIKWTFDPLQSLNLNFNLEKLGAIGRIYKENYYGNIRDSINKGLETDRFEAEWYISSKYVSNKLEGKIKTPSFEELMGKGAYLAIDSKTSKEKGKKGEIFDIEIPIKKEFKLNNKIVLISIPKEISFIKEINKDIAQMWRLYTREAYKFYLSNGYIAIGYTKSKNNGYVVLIKTSLNDLLEGDKLWS
ncbi:hypothetical protein Calag_0591 [Caldisphaera lagunensis DSM 15908]|uniref:N-acetyltransferase domain-containing protein n=1 Tax=Caldisphaera lagunensis (strain DSM 15908 / JCM 11604 / ANMR 0165 / IC-154) TaxID=1056495 RepID=L0A8Y6_CALLD|nr:hypothetical protein [Caldisphaera lagunensis]AFZ70348.1 hypothetical protein Calag_0591 [Caldisphaera lagunensis DSM 15908]